MEIRKTTASDLTTILELYHNARIFMADQGNPTQWGTTFPEEVMLIQDIEDKDSYICEEQGEIIATFFYKVCNDSTYDRIYEGQWLDDAPYGVIHRITSSGTIKGAASFCLKWALEQCGNLRIDTHRNNTIMQHMLEKNGFIYCGIIYVEDSSERLAYQKRSHCSPL